ncbi:hypothetical protein KEM52_001553 [Ascosphaera acerosa]|nr:hypothetical protein KEM52_001553 [Ascosphaera acerosa]
MVFGVYLTADLQGVTDLKPLDTEDAPYHYTFKIQCVNCREVHPNAVSFNRFVSADDVPPAWPEQDTDEVPGSRGEANLVWKCRGCGSVHHASIKEAPTSFDATSADQTQKIVELDCRGLTPLEFVAEGEWTAKGTESGTAFASIELQDGEWYEYDEKAGQEVSITDVRWEIRRS